MLMRVLVACEESQAVCKAFRELGHEAYSCDIQECSGGHPEWHILGDATKILNPSKQFIPGDEWFGFKFRTQDGVLHCIDGKWDLIIAHPPCTYLSNAGACRLYPQKGKLNMERYKKGIEAKEFFLKFLNADCPRIVVENPVSSKVFEMPKHTQEIHPYHFDPKKRTPMDEKTRLWIRGNLNPLIPTTPDGVPAGPYVPSGTGRKDRSKYGAAKRGEDAKNRAKTFLGIAKAMAEQWGGDNRNKEEICESD